MPIDPFAQFYSGTPTAAENYQGSNDANLRASIRAQLALAGRGAGTEQDRNIAAQLAMAEASRNALAQPRSADARFRDLQAQGLNAGDEASKAILRGGAIPPELQALITQERQATGALTTRGQSAYNGVDENGNTVTIDPTAPKAQGPVAQDPRDAESYGNQFLSAAGTITPAYEKWQNERRQRQAQAKFQQFHPQDIPSPTGPTTMATPTNTADLFQPPPPQGAVDPFSQFRGAAPIPGAGGVSAGQGAPVDPSQNGVFTAQAVPGFAQQETLQATPDLNSNLVAGPPPEGGPLDTNPSNTGATFGSGTAGAGNPPPLASSSSGGPGAGGGAPMGGAGGFGGAPLGFRLLNARRQLQQQQGQQPATTNFPGGFRPVGQRRPTSIQPPAGPTSGVGAGGAY